jgi:hypothetical protein
VPRLPRRYRDHFVTLALPPTAGGLRVFSK